MKPELLLKKEKLPNWVSQKTVIHRRGGGVEDHSLKIYTKYQLFTLVMDHIVIYPCDENMASASEKVFHP